MQPYSKSMTCLGLVIATGSVFAAAPAANSAAPTQLVRASNSPIPTAAEGKPLGSLASAGSPKKHCSADNGNGTYSNPLFHKEFEDPDVIRVGDTYYLAESFQWVNLMRGDTMLMSLTNHRYLATQPNTPGPVTVNSLGARPLERVGRSSNGKS